MKYVYFGTPQFAAIILDELLSAGFPPALIVTSPDKPSGRKLQLAPSVVKSWGQLHQVPVITPLKLRDDTLIEKLTLVDADIFIVAAYGKIIPEIILNIPKHGTLNVHPSLLPLLRGPSPIESSITSEQTETGVSIMKLDALMDHGPIIAQEKYNVVWDRFNPPKGSVLENDLAHQGGKLLSKILPGWMSGAVHAVDQNHDAATFCVKISKEDGQVNISDDPEIIIRKIRAYDTWPGTFFFVKHANRDIRVKITEAYVSDGQLIIDRVVPEGKKDMDYKDFMRGIK
jgi:methionyl-tRNA formyltransferase